ncbi:hypothetical protein C0993_005492 [Termitomyces sp. T159_Od127]|nr:hypothetical protein C0993_005492 [Termitomyces sp. T159_Od127]
MNHQPSDVDQLSDLEIGELLDKAEPLGKIITNPGPNDLFFGTSVYKLTTNTIVKIAQYPEDGLDSREVNALNFVFAKTTIPVPRVRRVVRESDGCFWIVMDHVPGTTLAQIWPTLSIWRKIWIAFTLRRYIRQLRRVRVSATTPPGPLSKEGPRRCESPVFGLHRPRGPFTSYSALSNFFNERHNASANIDKLPHDDPSRNESFDDSEPLVLTHQDLNLRNLILGNDGRIWMIDWGWSGLFPPWFEYVSMERQNEVERISGTNDPMWKAFIPFICGPYFRQKMWLKNVASGLYYG